MKILSKIELVDGKRKILIEPNENTFEVNFQLDYSNKIIGKQKILLISKKTISMMFLVQELFVV